MWVNGYNSVTKYFTTLNPVVPESTRPIIPLPGITEFHIHIPKSGASNGVSQFKSTA